MTQQFVASILATGALQMARPERGRFRTFLLAALRNFLTDDWRRSQTTKRGGGVDNVPIDLVGADQRFDREPVDENLTPDQAFDRAWAIEVFNHAFGRLREEYNSTGRGDLFTALAPLLLEWHGRHRTETTQASSKLAAHAMSMALHRMRTRFGLRLREEVASAMPPGSDVDQELRELISALRGPDGR